MCKNNPVNSRSQKACQTIPVRTSEAETQVRSVLSSSTQTDPPVNLTDQLALHSDLSAEPPGLREFLGRVEDLVIQELVKNSKSHAFDGYEVNWNDQRETVRIRHAGKAPSPVCDVMKLCVSRTGVVCIQSRVRRGSGPGAAGDRRVLELHRVCYSMCFWTVCHLLLLLLCMKINNGTQCSVMQS